MLFFLFYQINTAFFSSDSVSYDETLLSWLAWSSTWHDGYENHEYYVKDMLWLSHSPHLNPSEHLCSLPPSSNINWANILKKKKKAVFITSEQSQTPADIVPWSKLAWSWLMVAQHLTNTLHIGLSLNLSLESGLFPQDLVQTGESLVSS